MDNKLQELTDKLYNEGLSKGKEEGEALLAKAKSQAGEIVAEAEKKAAAIIAQAEKEAEDLKTKVIGDLKMAGSQSIQATKNDIESLIVAKMTKPVSNALSDEAFIKEIISAVAANFSASESKDLNLILPESLKSALEPFISNELSKILGGSVSASFSKKVSGGFTIGPKDGSYFISLSDETFKALIGEYLRPATRKLIFGE